MKIMSLFFPVFSLCVILATLSQSVAYGEPKQVAVAVLAVNKQQIDLFAEQFQRFNDSQSNIKVDVDFYSDKGLKSRLSGWLESGEYDLIHWQAGKRLDVIVEQELLLPIDTLISEQSLTKNVSGQLLDVVDINGSYQALPFGYYPWGFYYSKTVFAKHGIAIPNTWSEFLAICQKLKRLGVAPIVQANQEGWPLLAWLDFLALDNGGLSARQEFTEYASASREDTEKVVKQFSTLLDHGYFFAPDHSWRWERTITILLRQQAAMTLLGQFAESEIQAVNSSQIGYFPFPYSKASAHYPAVAPIDLFVVPMASKNHASLAALLNFLVQPEINKTLATGLGFLPVYPQFDGQGLSERASIGLQSLRQSSGLVQYFDRDAEPQYATNLANSIGQSILNGEPSVLKGALSGQEFVSSPTHTLDYALSGQLLNFSSFTGSRGTFFASNVLKAIYQKLGYSIAITRYQNLAETLESFKYGADGELVRADVFSDTSDDLIKVPEPLIETSLYLVCRTRTGCENKLPAKTRVGTSMDILVLKDWWKKENALKQVFANTASMLKEYNSGQLDFMIMSAIDVSAYQEQFITSSFRNVLTIPLFHFVHKKHQLLVDDINQGLIDFKKTPDYQAFQERYWLN